MCSMQHACKSSSGSSPRCEESGMPRPVKNAPIIALCADARGLELPSCSKRSGDDFWCLACRIQAPSFLQEIYLLQAEFIHSAEPDESFPECSVRGGGMSVWDIPADIRSGPLDQGSLFGRAGHHLHRLNPSPTLANWHQTSLCPVEVDY